MDFSSVKNIRIGDVLKEYGYATDEQINAALRYQQENRGLRLGEAMIALNYISEHQMLEALSKKLHVPLIDLRTCPVSMDAVSKIPQKDAERNAILGIQIDQNRLTVAVNDPMNFYGIEDIRQQTGMQLEIVLSEKKLLLERIRRCYADLAARRAAADINAGQSSGAMGNNRFANRNEVPEKDENETPITHLLSSLVIHAASIGASDIHIEPFENETIVRMRVDGVITKFETIPRATHGALISRIKILASLDIAERRIPQDGHFKMAVGNNVVNIRVSTIPTVAGEKAVLRLLALNTRIEQADTFGMAADDYRKFSQMLKVPYGIIYITGPTGSGKTTTLYMVIEELSKRLLNISTIEDPVEKNIYGVNQMQVNPQAGLTFETGLRALLRQDPDVIMLGETRDAETAEISIRAAITGHVVFSTLHTNDSVSAIIRLEDMGLEPYLLSSSLVGIVAQRLMRRLCPECKTLEDVTEEEARTFGPSVKKLYHAKGCEHCNHSGYSGRIAIHEILQIDGRIREMISGRKDAEEIKTYAIKETGLKTLRSAAEELVLAGVTTIDEMNRVSYET